MDRSRGGEAAVIAVCGKGGVGKTALSALMVKILMAHEGARVLAIDADPAVGLAGALGLSVRSTVDDVRRRLIADLDVERARTPESDRTEVLRRLDYQVLEALVEWKNLAFLAIGRPEAEGCYCQVNRLLKEIIGRLAADFDYVVIDGEAGIEQINRRVLTAVSHLILVSDTSLKGITVCSTLQRVAAAIVSPRVDGLILNRYHPSDAAFLPPLPDNLELMGTVEASERVRRFDVTGRSLLQLSDDPAIQSLQRCLRNLGLI